MYKNKKTRPAARTVGCLFALGALGLGSAAHAAEAFSPNSKWMLGDWGGKRTELLEKGYDFKLEYVGEAAANLDGGYDDDKTGRYTDQFALGVHMDLEKILGWKATEFQFTVTERNGKNLSNDRIGDPRAGHISSVRAYEQNPSNLETGNGFKMSGSGTKGALLPVELIWQPKVGAEQLPGEYRLGYYYSTAKADDVYDDVDGQPQGLTGNDFKSRGSKHGWWVVAQQQVTSHNGDASRGLSLFANLTVHDKATNVVDNYQQLGVVYKGPFDARPKDDIGLGIARIHVNDDVKKRQRLVNQVNGIDDYDNPLYQPLQDTEYNAELYYGVHVTDWLTVRPNLQYIKQPGGVDEVDNALVAGIKIQTVF
ncbi:porin [Pseudomonas aeruginosa]|uniref:carbohydrate porin n=1 Tax=Pseudomonas aeruginosa TaxID=287 RepID=UPI000FC42C46|nr:carbohydrate porin [Pseudomonas aeruginosa]RUD42819.1 porin [Pseudomonas aeruginosa]